MIIMTSVFLNPPIGVVRDMPIIIDINDAKPAYTRVQNLRLTM